MNVSLINETLIKIKLKLTEAFSTMPNNFKLKVELNNNDNYETANVNGAIFIIYSGESFSENFIKCNNLFFIKRKLNVEILGIITELNNNNINGYIDFIIKCLSGLKTANMLKDNYIIPNNVEIINQDDYGNYRFKLKFIVPIDLTFTGEVINEHN